MSKLNYTASSRRASRYSSRRSEILALFTISCAMGACLCAGAPVFGQGSAKRETCRPAGCVEITSVKVEPNALGPLNGPKTATVTVQVLGHDPLPADAAVSVELAVYRTSPARLGLARFVAIEPQISPMRKLTPGEAISFGFQTVLQEAAPSLPDGVSEGEIQVRARIFSKSTDEIVVLEPDDYRNERGFIRILR